ncbi:phenylalanine--tRNA ligase subunit beta [Pseudolysinimonas kribbensis]|uniref:Phenylalanine--tRNA ligase beta subunit n=1 Tax=Pseudolysinimonas kribbensis TaxID=433641 RepID=A0ABQ6JYY3_9MICO|nr:phenylalanine--tRNA ligase subunit beta [Pseudolysinimonas kribbensis]GMA93525.1 phenylalanine--tRNA ligase beta subunit [Pseudolysinimonas kribbensis]
MRVPLSWLGEWVDLPDDVSLESVHAALVRVGFEEEDVHGAALTGPIVVGQVLSAEPEPQSNGKTINWCSVDVGEPEPRGIVCGAHNFGPGDKVVVTLPGAVLPGPFPIAARTTYGHVSDGMIASARELGLGDEHDGILRLADLGLDPGVGADAIHLLGLDDAAVEINVTPDRGYALSIRGVAREYSHSTGAAFRDPAQAVTVATGSGFDVRVDDAAPIRGRVGASVFVTRAVRGIDPGRPTPPWMASRLRLAGIRSISLPVDITNYVMLELGQPIHGYDLARLTGGIAVRRATPGETLETLDGQVRTLSPEDLLITDDSGPIGLAGVMGGATTELSGATTDVLIEAANFDPISIARTARRHKLPSEASRRFERGVDPAVAAPAAQRVVDLLVQLAGGTADPLGSTLDESRPPQPIRLAPGRPAALTGVGYTLDEVRDALRLIGATVDEGAAGSDDWSVTPPTWRPDLIDDASLVEEVARITGYDRIPSLLPQAPAGRGLTRAQLVRRRVGTTLAAAGGTEVLAYPFLSLAAIERFEPGAPSVRLANPLDPQADRLRRSLLPGLLEVARRNLGRGLPDLALFELGSVVRPEAGAPAGTDFIPPGSRRPDDATLAALDRSIPSQGWRVAALFLGEALPKRPGAAAEPAGIADALDAARQVGLATATRIVPERGEHPALHPGRTAELRVGDRVVGVAGELLPSIAAELDLPRVVALLELDLDVLLELGAVDVQAAPLVTMPAATQDLSLVVPSATPAGDVLAAVVEGAGELLEHAALVDDYRGPGLPDGTKSLTFALRFRAPDRTLTAAEASEAKLAGAARAGELFGAAVRE